MYNCVAFLPFLIKAYIMTQSTKLITITIPASFSIDLSKEKMNHVKGDEYASGSKSILLSIDNQTAIVELIKIGLKSVVSGLAKEMKPIDNVDFCKYLNQIDNTSIISSITEVKARGAKKSEYPLETRLVDFKLVVALCAMAKQPISTLSIKWWVIAHADAMPLELIEQLYTKLVTIADKIESKYPEKFTDSVNACIRFTDYLDTRIQLKKLNKSITQSEVFDAEAEISID
jgi:hypothetical protein